MRWLLDKELPQVEWLEAQVVKLEQEIERRVLPFEQQIRRLITIPGIERKTAWAILAEQVYLRALRTVPNLTITFGHFPTHSVPMMLTGVTPVKKVWVDKTQEKGSDGNLAAHLVRDAFQNLFEVTVLITNDSDLAEPVRVVRRELGLPVGILNPHRMHSAVLKQLATFIKRIRQADLLASQFPLTMTDAKGQFQKPNSW